MDNMPDESHGAPNIMNDDISASIDGVQDLFSFSSIHW